MKNLFLLFIFLFLANFNYGQKKTLPNFAYIFASDSLAGFEETAAKNAAISEGFLGEEFKVRMWSLKRAYINSKYKIGMVKSSKSNSQYRATLVSPACVNEDFESSASGTITTANQINGWTVSSGVNSYPSTSCAFTTPNAPAESAIINCGASGFIDPVIGAVYPIYSVFGTTTNTGTSVNPGLSQMYGNNVIRLNNYVGDYSIEKLSKTFAVTSSNSLFQVAFIGVFFGGHSCCDGESFQIKLTNATTNATLACPGFSTSALSTVCSTTSTVNYLNVGTASPATSASGTMFNAWRINSLDLRPFIGQTITIDIIASDCTGGSHYGYAYIDAQCAPFTISLNGNAYIVPPSTFTVPVPSVTLLVCPNTTSSSISAPAGLGPYYWSGPAVPPNYAVPSLTNQVLNTSYVFAGTQTLVMNPEGGCGQSSVVVTSSISFPYPSFPTNNTVCIGSSANFTLSPSVSYSLNNTPITNTVNILPLVNTLYTITATNGPTCTVSNTLSINVNTTCADVWPGDANSDGMADNLDILELGLHFTQSGAARTSSSNTWQSYYSNNWVGTITNGKNLNHSDCDGSGIIDLDDTLAVYNNYSFIHAFRDNSVEVTNPQITITSDQNSIQSGYWGSASVYLGNNINPVNNINGVAFKINFDKTHIQQDSVYLEYATSFLNTANSNLNFRKTQFNNGALFAATTHTTNTNTSGNGKIAVFHFKVDPTFNANALFVVSVTQASQSSASGMISSLSASPASSVNIGNTVGLKQYSLDNSVSVFPNPSNGIITIKSNNEIKKVEVLNLTGQILLIETGKGNSLQLNLQAFEKGIYFVKIYNMNGNTITKKIVTKD